MDTIVDIEAARAINALRMTLVAMPDRAMYVEDTYTAQVRALLMTALRRIVGGSDARADELFDCLLDGADVADALAYLRKTWIAAEFDDALTFELRGPNAYYAEDNERRYLMGRVADGTWHLLAQDLHDESDIETLGGFSDKWSAELVARALNAYDYANDTRTGLTAARDRALAAIERHKCHGCARDAHGKGHIANCPQATDVADYAGRTTEELQA